MTAQITINPLITSTAAGLFNVTSRGYIQGLAIDDEAIRYQLIGGLLASTETLPMWGGVAIAENIPKFGTTLPEKSLGPSIVRATSLASFPSWDFWFMRVFVKRVVHMIIPLFRCGPW
jgi:hypothetical protein